MSSKDIEDTDGGIKMHNSCKEALEGLEMDGVNVWWDFEFPEPVELTTRLKDVLEDEVDEKFYLSDERVGKLTFRGLESKTNVIATGDSSSYEQNNRVYDIEKESPTITARDYKDPKGGGGREPMVMLNESIETGKVMNVGNVNPSGRGMNGSVYDSDGLSPTLTTNKGEGIKIIPREVVIAASRGRNPNNPSDRTVGSPTEQRLEINKHGVSNTLTTVQKDNYVIEMDSVRDDVIGEIVKDFDIPKEILNDNERQRRVYNTNGISPTVLARADSTKIHNCFRIRKLTPLECWRLMGFSDEDFHKAEAVNSNSQLYKQAGNSIVVSVLEGIFGKMFKS